jgi:hypothetical protein
MSAAGPRFLVRFPHGAAPARAAGVGFLVAERHILTCAHVVNLALGRDERAPDRPSEQDFVYVEFPLADGAICRAHVERWQPPPSSGISGGDIAGLIVVGGSLPSGVEPAQLTSGAPAGCQVEVFGYPSGVGRPDGVWASGRVLREVRKDLLQIDADREGAWRAQFGFSGGPVIDRATGAVIGMFKAADPYGGTATVTRFPPTPCERSGTKSLSSCRPTLTRGLPRSPRTTPICSSAARPRPACSLTLFGAAPSRWSSALPGSANPHWSKLV